MKNRGIGFRNLVDFIKKKFGERGFQKFLDLLDKEGKMIYSNVIFSSNWYPFEEQIKALEVVTTHFYGGDKRWLVEYGRFVAQQALTGIYKTYAKLGSPEHIISQAAKLTNRYFEGVRGSTIIPEKGKVLAKYEGFNAQHQLIELTIQGFGDAALEISGAKNVKSKIVTSLAQGKGYIEIAAFWDK